VSHSLLSDNSADSRNICASKWAPSQELVDLASDDEGLIAEVIDLFKTGGEARLHQMRIAVTTADIQSLRSEAHSLRGSAVQLGANALVEACRRLELAQGLTPVSHLVELVDRVRTLFAEVSSEMASYPDGTQVGDLQLPRSNRGQ
jgi:HPt (histidine-containing phosphotransfer) domain-containing protein